MIHMTFLKRFIRHTVMLCSLWLAACPVTSYSQDVNAKTKKTKGQAYEYHEVQKGETLYSISKQYQTKVDTLLLLNPELSADRLPVGTKLKVPSPTQQHASQELKPVYHRVKKKETLYSIGREYQVDLSQLQKWNQLPGTDIEQGSQLIVGYEDDLLEPQGPLLMNRADTRAEQAAAEKFPAGDQGIPDSKAPAPSAEVDHFPAELAQRGIVTWVKSTDQGEAFYALHPTAAKGTEVLLRNVMNGKTVTVKVIGKLPATSANEDVMIKISGSAARKLGVLDDKFLADMYFPEMQHMKTDEMMDIR